MYRQFLSQGNQLGVKQLDQASSSQAAANAAVLNSKKELEGVKKESLGCG